MKKLTPEGWFKIVIVLSVIGFAASVSQFVTIRSLRKDIAAAEVDAKIGTALCGNVRHRLAENLAVLHGPQTPLQLELLATIGGERYGDGAEALALCTKVDITKIAECRATIPDPSCLIDVLERN